MTDLRRLLQPSMSLMSFLIGLSLGSMLLPKPTPFGHSLSSQDLDIAMDNPSILTKQNNADKTEDEVHVLYTVCGNDTDFMDEFGSSLKSTLMNSPLDMNMTIHIISDGNGYKSIGRVFKESKLDQIIARNQISIKTYNVQSHMEKWAQQLKNATGLRYSKKHTMGTFFRLFAVYILPEDVEHAIIIDSDVAIIANLQDLWRHRDSSKMLQWGEDTRCAGFVIWNYKIMRQQFWKLVKETFTKLASTKPINETFGRKIRDQVLTRTVAKDHPQLVSYLPPEWDLHRADNIWKWKGDNGVSLLANRPKAGMLHMNGEQSSNLNNKFKTRYDNDYGTVVTAWSYYGEHPWEWSRFMLESQLKPHDKGHQITLDYSP